MYCKKCGQEIDDNVNVCPECGAVQNAPEPGVQPPQYPNPPYPGDQGQYTQPPQPAVEDNGGFLWGLLGCCIPLVGLILFLVWKDQKPKTAKAVGIGALVGVGVTAVLYILSAVLGVAVGLSGLGASSLY